MSDIWGKGVFEGVMRRVVDRAMQGDGATSRGWLDLPRIGRRYFAIEYRTCRDPDGAVSGVVASGRDMTEYKLAEEALQESEARYRAVTRATNDVVWDWDINTGALWWNENAFKVFGFRRNEIEPGVESWVNRIHPDDRDRVASGFHALVASGGTGWADEYRMLRADGSTAWIYDRGFVMHDAAGKAIRMIGAMMDITARKREEEGRVLVSTRNEALVKALGEIVYESWPQEDKVFWSGEYTRILGYGTDEIGSDSSSWFDRLHADDIQRVQEELLLARKGNRLFELEYRFLRKDGSYVWMHDRGMPFLDAAGELQRVVGVFSDITERKKAEVALRESEQRLQLALEALDGGVWDWNLKSNETYRSPRWLKMLGYAEDEIALTRDAWLELIHPEDQQRVMQEHKEHFEGRTPALSYEYRLRTKAGNWLWTATRGKLVERAADGTPLRAAGANINISDRKLAEEVLTRKAREEEFISELTRMIVSGRNLDDILGSAVRGAAEILTVEFAKVLELMPASDQLRLRAGTGWREGVVGMTSSSKIRNTLATFTLDSAEAVIVEDLDVETRFGGSELLLEHGILSGVSVIIGESSRPFGVFGIYARARRIYGRDEVRFLENLASILAEAIHSRRTEDLVLQSRERLRNLAARLHRVREEERAMVAREIHDELGQNLTGLRIDLSWLLDRLPPGKKRELSERAKAALKLVDTTLEAVRRLSHDLRPAMLDDLGLEAAIEWQIGEFAQRTGCRCTVDLSAGAIGLDNERDTAVFRILQEALTNVTRHAAANRVKVLLQAPEDRLVLEVTDNGRGIRDEEMRSSHSLGLIGMRERAGAMGGRVQVSRGRRRGTIVHLEMPLHRH